MRTRAPTPLQRTGQQRPRTRYLASSDHHRLQRGLVTIHEDTEVSGKSLASAPGRLGGATGSGGAPRPPCLAQGGPHRIVAERRSGRTWSEIGRCLDRDGVATSQGGPSRWWPASIRDAYYRMTGETPAAPKPDGDTLTHDALSIAAQVG